jgi:hypothetical protein
MMKGIGFEPFDSDLCLFINKEKGVLLILYVDDMLILAYTKEDIFSTAKQIEKKFKIKPLREVQRFLGYKVTRDRENRTIGLSQEEYARKIVNKYGYNNLNSVQTLWPSRL